ncbi:MULTISPECIES: HIRAN domain-containing protein [Delftia]|uniref:HIRAN domain-containing protein n=1 Tax=Delftia deserti TaxID=1651218 RepID=A0ABW5EQN5_9BURK|nr:HIRAN domain-containing protein [Delftia sp. UME58]MBB1648466.1 hypothetical protein [Delftia sp. UME58]
MSSISHLCEPSRLLLTWQGLESATNPKARYRYVVGELVPTDDPSVVTFRYLSDTPDFRAAREYGFKGHPAFRLNEKESVWSDVLQTFMRRLPPRKREDFPAYLQRHLLPHPFALSDLALLGYTGARLPSDGFSLSPVFDCTKLPCQLVTEVAGTRHYATLQDVEAVRVEDVAELILEPENETDPEAIRVDIGGKKMGYINRVVNTNVHGWLEHAVVTAKVCKKNGTPERPLIYIAITAQPK